MGNTEGVVTITNSTLARNVGTGGGGFYSEKGIVTLRNSTLVNNNGNIVKGTGVGVFIIGGTASITNTTIAGNEALRGDGL